MTSRVNERCSVDLCKPVLSLHRTHGVRVLRTDKQKDNVSKFSWDMAKIALTFFVIAPFASPERVAPSKLAAGLFFALALGVGAYIIDGRESR